MEKNMSSVKNAFFVSPLRVAAVFTGMAAVWLFTPEIINAAVPKAPRV